MKTATGVRPRRRGRLAPVVVALLALSLAAAAAGLVLRAVAAPLWPAMLTDWSLGSALLTVSSAAVGAVVALRVHRNVIGWVFLLQGVFTGVVFCLRQLATVALGGDLPSSAAVWAAWGFTWAIPVNMTLLTLAVLLFPHGAPPSRRWRPVVAGIVVAGVASMFAAMFSPYLNDAQTLFADLPNPAAVVPAEVGAVAVDVTSQAVMIGLILAVIGLALRGRRSRGVERQQIKWFVYAAVVAVSTFTVGFWIAPLFVVATLLALPAVPIAAGVAITRYRLYDIDRVINRTVVYAVVTGVLAVAYVAAIAVVGAVTAPLTRDTAPAVAASTLAVAALFGPVRRRVQVAVDRRFNRARYDATATVQRFSSRLRDEVELDTLRTELLRVVGTTMQPAASALWLRESQS